MVSNNSDEGFGGGREGKAGKKTAYCQQEASNQKPKSQRMWA